MLEKLRIENYKSIDKLELNLGRVNVFIGENGSGKSNILEAIALGAAAASNKLDNEFLAPRGIRVTEPQLMRSAFDKDNLDGEIKLSFYGENDTKMEYILTNENKPYSKWYLRLFSNNEEPALISSGKPVNQVKTMGEISRKMEVSRQVTHLPDFLIYSPQNPALRTFEKEGQIQPLGINGEGLFKLLKVLSLEPDKIKLLKEKMELIDWFEDLEIPSNLYAGEQTLKIADMYLDPGLYFDQKSTNEGFLFLLFYFSLFISDDTPKFFAIDNIDASLNPKLCRHLIKQLAKLAVETDRQTIFTTHNPGTLDGLNLGDDRQRLFVIYRNKLGHTKSKRIFKPDPLPGQEYVRLSEAFLNGYIGGLPKNF
jgi:AAA15 family ATPase/GTPase